MIKLYSSPFTPHGEKIELFLAESRIPYSYHTVDLLERQHRDPGYRSVHPAAKIPAIDDDGFRLFESLTILRYLAERFGEHGPYPEDLRTRAEISAWMEYVSIHVVSEAAILSWECSFAPRLRSRLGGSGPSLDAGGLSPEEVSNARVFLSRGRLAKSLAVIEAQLQGRLYLCGEQPTLADFSLLPGLDMAIRTAPESGFEALAELDGGAGSKEFSALSDYWQRCRGWGSWKPLRERRRGYAELGEFA